MEDKVDYVFPPAEDDFGPFTLEELEECFNTVDLNKNGIIDADEIRKYDTKMRQCQSFPDFYSKNFHR